MKKILSDLADSLKKEIQEKMESATAPDHLFEKSELAVDEPVAIHVFRCEPDAGKILAMQLIVSKVEDAAIVSEGKPL